MKKWFSTRDLAGLPGMPKTESAVTRKAKRERYIARFRKGKGGGKEYHISNLPSETQAALHFKETTPAPVPKSITELQKQEEIKQDLTSLKKWQRDVMTARLVLYREFERLQTLMGTTRAVDQLVVMARTGTLPDHIQQYVEQANVRKGKNGRTLSKSMVLGWQRTVREKGIGGLAPKAPAKYTIPDWAPYFIKCFQQPQKPSIPEAMEDMAKILPENIPMPSYHQVRRFHNKRSAIDKKKGRHSIQAMKRFKGFIRRSADNLMPMDVGQCDGHSFKAKVAHPEHGRPFHPEVCAVLDWRTRVCTGWSVGLAESSITVAGAILHSVQTSDKKPYGGVFAILYTDKGAGNESAMVSGPVTGLLARCGTVHETGLPGNAQGRGLVEKSNKSIWIRAAKKLETFTGSTMDKTEERRVYLLMDREVKKKGSCSYSGLPSWEQFLQICQQAVDEYNLRPHSSLPKVKDPITGRVRHLSPLEMWANYLEKGWEPTTLPSEIVDDLERPQVTRKARRCEVSVFGNTYYSPDLVDYHGHKVIVEYDIHDAREVRVRDVNHRLICKAQFERNKRAAFPVPAVEKARDDRAKRRLALIEEKRAEIEAEHRGTVELENDITMIDVNEDAAQRVMERSLEGEGDLIEYAPQEEISFTKPEREPAVVRLNTTMTEDYFDIWNDLQATGRRLTRNEYAWLKEEFYPTDAGQLQLKLQGDLTEMFGLASERQVEI